jgi:hypothetical protein
MFFKTECALMKTFYLGLLLIILTGTLLNAQSFDYSAKQELLQSQIKKLSVVNDSIFKVEDHHLNGRLFYPTGNKFINPFFIDNDWKSGKIWSYGKTYDTKMLKYDIYSDHLVFLHYWSSYAYPIYLNRDVVTEFIFIDHHFRYLNDFKNSSEGELKPGYYEVIYDGATKYYARWEKLKNPHYGVSDQGYSQRSLFFLKKDGKYMHLKNQSDLMKALSDHKKEIKTYMKNNALHFSVANYDSLIKVLEYYDNL